MKASDFIRDPHAVRSLLTTLPDKRVVAKKELSIHIPTRFIDLGMATLGVSNSTLGFIALVSADKRYGVMRIPSIVRLGPARISRAMIDNRDYTILSYGVGEVVFEATGCVKTSKMVYYIFDELFMNGNVPWYIQYDDMVCAFSGAQRFAGTRVASNQVAVSILASHLARNPENKTLFYRHLIRDRKDLNKLPVTYIGLGNVQYAPTTTMYRLAGSYMEDAMVTALNNPSDRSDGVEKVLRA